MCLRVSTTREEPATLGPIWMDSAGALWLQITSSGGDDPEGIGGSVHPELGGSSCRWISVDPDGDRRSLERRAEAARAFHER